MQGTTTPANGQTTREIEIDTDDGDETIVVSDA